MHYYYNFIYLFDKFVNQNFEIEIPPNGHCDSAKRAFRCDDGRCLPRDQVCDISKDCPGGEDEDQDCGTFYFVC